jgi:UDP-N-acetylmuramoylalanine--D-glutamate ligase
MSQSGDGRPVQLCSRGVLEGALRRLAGKRVTLMGLGTFGGGTGAASFLAGQGAHLTVTDLRPAEKLQDSLAALEGLPITYHLSGHRPEDFTAADLVLASPAVPRTSAYLQMAEAAGVPIASPMNAFLTLCPAPIAAVTGSNGKSTTTALLARMLQGPYPRAWLGGNIGICLLCSLPLIRPQDVVVLELSSFQLEDAEALQWSPHAAVVTNITPNHLDRHGTMDAYEAAKRCIVRHQTAADYAILNAADPLLARWVRQGLAGQVVLYDARRRGAAQGDGVSVVGDCLVWREGNRDEVVCRATELALPGRHNMENALAAGVAARCLGARPANLRDALHTFSGLEHRLELVGEFGGIRFYNDSFSTTPESTIAALQSFQEPLTLVVGGYDKKLDLMPIARAAARCAEVVVTIGQTGPALARRTLQEGVCLGHSMTVREVRTLEEAVREAAHYSMPGSCVLFSPGCASYDMFDNCVQRGELFRRAVLDIVGTNRALSRPA